MNAKLNKVMKKLKKFFDKALKNKSDANLNSRVKNEAEYRKMFENMKNY